MKKPFFLIIFVAIATVIMPVSSLEYAYRTAYQGLDVQFYAVEWNGHLYTNDNPVNPDYREITITRGGLISTYTQQLTGEPSSLQLHDRLNFDPDMADDGKPNIMGSCSPIIIDLNNPTEHPWTLDEEPHVVKVSNETGSWNVTTTTQRQFMMLQYNAYFSVNFYLAGHHSETYPGYSCYNDAAIWLKFTPNDFVYFVDNPNTPAKIAMAYMTLADQPEWSHYDVQQGVEVGYGSQVAKIQSVFPGAKGETPGFFDNVNGQPSANEQRILSQEGIELDTRVFKNEYYVRLGLDVFQPWTDVRPLGWYEKLPSVKLNFLLHVFAVGSLDVVQEEWVQLERHMPIEVETPLSNIDIELPDYVETVGGVIGRVIMGSILTIIVVAAIVVMLIIVVYGSTHIRVPKKRRRRKKK